MRLCFVMLLILLKDVTHKKEDLCCLHGSDISLYQQQYQYNEHFQKHVNMFKKKRKKVVKWKSRSTRIQESKWTIYQMRGAPPLI